MITFAPIEPPTHGIWLFVHGTAHVDIYMYVDVCVGIHLETYTYTNTHTRKSSKMLVTSSGLIHNSGSAKLRSV